MKIFHCVLTLSWLLLSSGATARADSPKNPPVVAFQPEGLEFELKLPEGKTQFQIGETIRIRLLFSTIGTQKLKLNVFHQAPPSLLAFASFDVEPKNGFQNPLADLPRDNFISISGYVPPPVVLGEKPTEMPLVLNEFVRFDAPGTYTIRAKTNNVFVVPEGKPAPREPSFFGGNSLATSSPLTIQIVPADPKWQQQQVAAWRALFASQKVAGKDIVWKRDVVLPASDLRFLNTRAAALAIIDRLGQDEFPRSSGSEAGFWRAGLIGFSERLWLIEAMKNAIKRPDYAVTQGFLDNLATLQTLHHQQKGEPKAAFFQVPEKFVVADWNLAFNSLTSKKGRVRALTIHSLVESAWLSSLEKSSAVKPRLARLVALVPDIYTDLPRLPQEYLLSDSPHWKEWSRIKSPRMVAPLVQVWKTVRPKQGWAMERGNLILRRIVELDPRVGRQLILQEMASPHPRVTFKVLSLLNDRRLPQLQNRWLAILQENRADQDQSTAALLIGRYATPAIKMEVEQAFAQRKQRQMLSFEISRGLNRYLTRVKTP